MQKNIIELIQNRHPNAIAQLYDAYGSSVYGVILRIVSSQELAEQATQDTFLKVWRYGPKYDRSKGTLFTWLINIARNTAIDTTRNRHFRHSKKIDNLEPLMNHAAAESIKPDLMGLNEEVHKLEEKYQVLIELVYLKGYTQQEAAEEIGMPLGTVKTRIRSAILELRRVYV